MLLLGKTICEFDELQYDILHNQILKSTLLYLLKCSDLDSSIKSEIRSIYKNFHKVNLIRLNNEVFRKVHIHRNIKHYDLLLRICRLIYDNSSINENSENLVFQRFYQG